jgi:hypothetical protein
MTSVYEQRRRLERALKRELPSTYLIVSGPDHPLLLRAADLLVAGKGSLFAVFLPTAHERNDPEALKARLTINLLALSQEAIPVLVIGEGAEDVAGMVASNFAEVIELRHTPSLAKIVMRKPSWKPLPRETHLIVNRRFGQALRMSRVMGLLHMRAKRGSLRDQPQFMFQAASEKRQRSHARVGRSESSELEQAAGVPVAAFSSGRTNSEPFVQLVNEQSAQLYSLDKGIPYPKRAPLGIAFVHSWPVMGRDPYKLIRAAAFGGWSMMLLEQLDSSGNRLRHIGARMRAAGEIES